MTRYRLMSAYRKVRGNDLLCCVGGPLLKAVASGHPMVRISDVITGMAKCLVLVFVYNETRHAWGYIRQVPPVVLLHL